MMAPLSGGISGLFRNTADARSRLGALQEEVRPGFGALSQAARESIRHASLKATGDLRQSLSRRGVLGSSFAGDAISRVERDFAAQESQAMAEAKIGEIELSAK